MIKNTNITDATKRPVISKYSLRIHGGNILFMLPAFIFFAFVVLIPFFQGIPYSFTNWKSIISKNYDFIGLKNYATLLTNKYFLNDFAHTFHFTILYIIASNIIGLALAFCYGVHLHSIISCEHWYSCLLQSHLQVLPLYGVMYIQTLHHRCLTSQVLWGVKPGYKWFGCYCRVARYGLLHAYLYCGFTINSL